MDTQMCRVAGSVFLVALLAWPHSASSRVGSLSGSIALEQEYESNIFHDDHDEEDRWKTTLIPTLTLSSQGNHDQFTITAGSDLAWDQRLDERDFEHTLSFSGSREISQYLKITLSDDYAYSDLSPRQDFDAGLSITEKFRRADSYEQSQVVRLLFPELDPYDYDYLYVLSEVEARYNQESPSVQSEVDSYLSNTSGRRRQWDNDFSIGAEYEFAKDSVLAVGYRYYNIDDRTADIIEYHEHNPNVSLSYRFSPQWLASVSYEFTKGQYDQSNDLRQHDTVLLVDYTMSQADQLIATYEYDSQSYQGDRQDIITQTGGLDWNHDFDIHTRLATSLQADYLARESSADESGMEINATISHTLPKGSFSVGAGSSFDQFKKEGSWDDLRESWTLDGDVSYELLQNLTGTASL